MKKILCILTIILTFGFLALDWFGGTIRDFVSPDVEAGYPGIIDTGDRMFLTLPLTALEEGADGAYLFVLSRCDKFPEEAYTAAILPVAVEKRDDEQIYIALGALKENDYVVTRRYGELRDGERVHIVSE